MESFDLVAVRKLGSSIWINMEFWVDRDVRGM
jgi:hypothetical protein